MRALVGLLCIAAIYGGPIAVGALIGTAASSYVLACASALAVYTVIGLYLLDAFEKLKS